MKLGALIIHGMGCQKPDFAVEMIEEVSDRIQRVGVNPKDIVWQPVYWADLLQPAEDSLWERMSSANDLNFVKLRQFVISNFGDAIAYQPGTRDQENVYNAIHKRIHENILELRKALGNSDKPLVVLAHSLGCAMMSNYIWDRQHGYDKTKFGKTAFERMETLTGLVTFGCNIPLFTLAYPKVVSIEFPPSSLPPALKAAAQWLNYFDADDVLGYPLKQLSPSYAKAVTRDVEINVGGILSSWNPMSHTDYWEDNDFTKPVSKFLMEILSVLP